MPFSQPLTVAKRAVQNRGNQTHSRLPSAHQSWTKPQLHFPAINGYPYRLFHQEVRVSHLPFRTSGVKRKGKDGTYETHALIYKYINELSMTVYDSLLQMARRWVPCRQILAPCFCQKMWCFLLTFSFCRFYDPCCSIFVFLAFWSAFEFLFFFLIFTMPPSKSSKLLSLLSSWVQYHLSPTCAYPLAAEDMASMMAAMAGKMGPVPPRPFVGKGGKAPIGHSWLGGGRWWDNSVQGWWRWWWWCFGGQPPSSEKNTLVIHFYEGNLNYPLKKIHWYSVFWQGPSDDDNDDDSYHYYIKYVLSWLFPTFTFSRYPCWSWSINDIWSPSFWWQGVGGGASGWSAEKLLGCMSQ